MSLILGPNKCLLIVQSEIHEWSIWDFGFGNDRLLVLKWCRWHLGSHPGMANFLFIKITSHPRGSKSFIRLKCYTVMLRTNCHEWKMTVWLGLGTRIKRVPIKPHFWGGSVVVHYFGSTLWTLRSILHLSENCECQVSNPKATRRESWMLLLCYAALPRAALYK